MSVCGSILVYVCVHIFFLPKLRLFLVALSKDGEQQSDHSGHQQTKQQTDPHVAPLDLHLG